MMDSSGNKAPRKNNSGDQPKEYGPLRSVSKQRPCPVCGGDSWCSIAEGEGLVICRRERNGAKKEDRDCNGKDYFVHVRKSAGGRTNRRSSKNKRNPSPSPGPASDAADTHAGEQPAATSTSGDSSPDSPRDAETAIEKADPDTLDFAHRVVLSKLSLSDTHRNDLHARDFTDDEIEYRGYGSLTSDGAASAKTHLLAQLKCQGRSELAKRIPGFFPSVPQAPGQDAKSSRFYNEPGLVIPVRDTQGRIIANQLRTGKEDRKYAWISSASGGGCSPGSPIHVPLFTTLQRGERVTVVGATEGPLKADYYTAKTGRLMIAFAGVDVCLKTIEILKEIGAEVVQPAFDADARRNVHVAATLKRYVSELTDAGFKVELLTWDIAKGKGVDDLLRNGHQPEIVPQENVAAVVSEIVAEAEQYEKDHPRSPVERSRKEVLDRLMEVLETGGAPSLFKESSLLESLAKLSLDDKPAYATCRAELKKHGVSLQDFKAVIKEIALRISQDRPPELARGETGGFFEGSGCICRKKQTPDGTYDVPLANFTAEIVDETTRDDGVERQLVFGIKGTLASGRGLPRLDVAAEKFTEAKWVVAGWGADAIVWPGENKALPAAIQALSDKKQSRTVYTHSGWRKHNDAWVYLHRDGAIGPAGWSGDVSVELPLSLTAFALPKASDPAASINAIRAALRMLDDGFAPIRIAAPLLAAVFRSVLGPADFSVHLVGPTGVFKSELAALAQQFFGAGFDSRHLPGSWSSTANALEAICFAAKDALLTVDDFVPAGAVNDSQRLNREADRLLRAQGNNSGRQRMRPDGSVRPTKPPRGMILSTGEDTPAGQSLRARLLICEVSPGDVKTDRLTECQRDAASGLFAECLASYLAWLSPDYEAIRNQLAANVRDVREEITKQASKQHARTPGIAAELVYAIRLFLKFARAAGAITDAERESLRKSTLTGIVKAASGQAAHQESAEPTGQFIRLLSAALSAGRAHVAGPDGFVPADSIAAWGWRYVTIGTGLYTREEWQPNGERVGWVEAEDLYLEPDASYSIAQRMAASQGTTIAVSAATLRKRLSEKNLLVSTGRNANRDSLLVRKTLGDGRKNVLHLRPDSIIGNENDDKADEIGQSELTNGQSKNDPLTTANGSGEKPCDELGSVVSANGEDTAPHANKNTDDASCTACEM
jgi:Domain of unknown function (DUF3854)/Domain of unknown function (DUF927)